MDNFREFVQFSLQFQVISAFYTEKKTFVLGKTYNEGTIRIKYGIETRMPSFKRKISLCVSK